MAETARFNHSVYFWLREGGTQEDANRLAEGCRKYLTGIPGVERIEIGFPAGTQRAVVDNSYGVALLIQFADAAAHDLYQDHPDHHRFIEACQSLWSRVQIYDALVV
jgi:hypothetical protein